MILSIKMLRNLRIQLGISRKVIAWRLLVSISTVRNYELGYSKMPFSYHKEYESFLLKVLSEEINPPRNRRFFYEHLNPSDCVSHETAKSTKLIRLAAKVNTSSAGAVIGKSHAAIIQKERGYSRMLKSEYEALLNFYKAEKIKKIFGGKK